MYFVVNIFMFFLACVFFLMSESSATPVLTVRDHIQQPTTRPPIAPEPVVYDRSQEVVHDFTFAHGVSHHVCSIQVGNCTVAMGSVSNGTDFVTAHMFIFDSECRVIGEDPEVNITDQLAHNWPFDSELPWALIVNLTLPSDWENQVVSASLAYGSYNETKEFHHREHASGAGDDRSLIEYKSSLSWAITMIGFTATFPCP